jgi:hypothetical protein
MRVGLDRVLQEVVDLGPFDTEVVPVALLVIDFCNKNDTNLEKEVQKGDDDINHISTSTWLPQW